jgi:hypothetical protein
MNFATGCVDCRYLELAIVRKAISVNVACDDAAMRNRVGVGVEFDRPLHFRCSAGKGLPAPAPAAAPPASPTTTPAASPPAASKQSHDQEKQDGTDGGVDDCTEHSRTEMNAHPRQQPTSDKSAQNPDDEVTDDPKTGATYDLPRQPARNQAHEQYDQQALTGHIHLATSAF